MNLTDATDYVRRHLEDKSLTHRDVALATYYAQKYLGTDPDGEWGNITRAEAERRWDGGRFPIKTEMVWPMGTLQDGRKPLVTSGYGRGEGSPNWKDRPGHSGVDILYQYLPSDGELWGKIGDGGRTKSFGVPLTGLGSYARACYPGRVVLTGLRPTGHRVWLDIGNEVYLGYFHLENSPIIGRYLMKGEYIGRINHNPIDNDPRHLHFEVHVGDLDKYPAGLMDPEVFLKGVPYL